MSKMDEAIEAEKKFHDDELHLRRTIKLLMDSGALPGKNIDQFVRSYREKNCTFCSANFLYDEESARIFYLSMKKLQSIVRNRHEKLESIEYFDVKY